MPMPTTITLKNIPDDIYRRLKDAAASQHRSINSEVIACLERALVPATIGIDERLARARQVRESLDGPFRVAEIGDAIRSGRK